MWNLPSTRSVDYPDEQGHVFQMHYFGTLFDYMQEKSDISKLGNAHQHNLDGQFAVKIREKWTLPFIHCTVFNVKYVWSWLESALIPLWTQRSGFKSFKPSWWRTIRWRAVSHHWFVSPLTVTKSLIKSAKFHKSSKTNCPGWTLITIIRKCSMFRDRGVWEVTHCT